MKLLAFIPILSLCFISCYGEEDTDSYGDQDSIVDYVETGDFNVLLSSSKWKREAGWVTTLEMKGELRGGSKIETLYANKHEITYELALYRVSPDKCIATLRSDHFRTVLMEIHTLECSDVSEFIGVEQPVKVESFVDGLEIRNVIHEIHVLFKHTCIRYLIDSMQNVVHVSIACSKDRVTAGSELWSKCFPEHPKQGYMCTTAEELVLRKDSDIYYVKTKDFKTEDHKETHVLDAKLSTIVEAMDVANGDETSTKKFVLYELEQYLFPKKNLFITKLVASDFHNKVTLMEFNNDHRGNPYLYMGIKEPSYDGKKIDRTTHPFYEMVHDISLVIEDTCLRFKITVIDSHERKVQVLSECDGVVPFDGRFWNRLNVN